ncbi:hypothetical protein OIE62_06800 [Streptomyces scopuliridis]|uniref:Uncharacterized protein n=1 Tax=Streptomyces scopuliridis TaxID=452529 RepID=A0ACD4ZTU0_9ACTN|nr:hypothetical protein [Streptomyces scopuliridis]WSC01711.1 hypothetical protein OG835_35020 [Streptomyces scopuliridis]WSC04750.1 hypothetical protein OIE62_06800 [Streptomyces scopuliridis]
MPADDEFLTLATLRAQQDRIGDRVQRKAVYDLLLRSGRPHLLFWQGTRGADKDNRRVQYEVAHKLGLWGWLGQGAHTAVFADPEVFLPLGEWDNPYTASLFLAPPTAVFLQLVDAGPASTPIAALSGRVSGSTGRVRSNEAHLLTGFTATPVRRPDGEQRRVLVIGGLDTMPSRSMRPDPGQMLRRAFDASEVPDIAHHLAGPHQHDAIRESAETVFRDVGRLHCSRQLLPAWAHIRRVTAANLPAHSLVVGRAHRDTLAALLVRLVPAPLDPRRTIPMPAHRVAAPPSGRPHGVRDATGTRAASAHVSGCASRRHEGPGA